jgi:hypothetical protein
MFEICYQRIGGFVITSVGCLEYIIRELVCLLLTVLNFWDVIRELEGLLLAVLNVWDTTKL